MSSKNMLAPIMRALVGVPVEFLGVIRDLINKLAGTDGKLWYEKICTILREKADFVQVVTVEITQIITVLCDLSLLVRISVGKYDKVNEHFTESNFPHDPTSVGVWEWRIFDFGRFISSENAAAAMIAGGWDPAKLEYVLSFGEQYPDEQRKYPIDGLGSSCSLNGARHVPRLWGNCTERGLSLRDWREDAKRSLYDWGHNDQDNYRRFLAVRKV